MSAEFVFNDFILFFLLLRHTNVPFNNLHGIKSCILLGPLLFILVHNLSNIYEKSTWHPTIQNAWQCQKRIPQLQCMEILCGQLHTKGWSIDLVEFNVESNFKAKEGKCIGLESLQIFWHLLIILSIEGCLNMLSEITNSSLASRMAKTLFLLSRQLVGLLTCSRKEVSWFTLGIILK